MGKLDRLVWVGQSTVRVGDLYLGVRCTDADVHAMLERALAAHLVRGVDAPPNYSVQIDRNRRGHATPLHSLYEGAGIAARSRDPRRVVRSLFSHLGARGSGAPAGLLSVAATPLVTGGSAVLGPVAIKGIRAAVERGLRLHGLGIVDVPSVYVDTDRAEVVVVEPDLQVDSEALEALDDLVASHGEPDIGPAAGRYPLTGWAVLVEGHSPGRLEPTAAVVRAAQSVNDLGAFHAREVLERVLGLLQQVPMVAVGWDDTADIVASLAALSR